MSISTMNKLTVLAYRNDTDAIVRKLMGLRCVQIRRDLPVEDMALEQADGTGQRALIEARLSRIAREYAARDAFSWDAVRAELAQLLILLARSQQRGEEVAADQDFVSEAISYMQAHYAQGVSLREVAAHCAVSYEHLSRTFKKRTGFGFNEYLTLYRLKQAEALLLGENELSVGEIADRCGFNDSNYFAERFGQIYGLAPTALRRQGREAAPRKIFLP